MRLPQIAVAGLLVLLFLWAAAVSAQEITGNISGVVKDNTGAVLADATVTVVNTDQNVVLRKLKTNKEGMYVAATLPIGRYSLTFEAAGFRPFTHTGIVLNVSDKLTYSVTLQVGSATDSVTVEANPLQVETQTVAAAGLITGTEVRELSINNRNYEQLVALQPGVSSNASDQIYVGVSNPSGQVNTVQFSINGARASQNNWTVDGADNVDRGSNLTLLTYPSVDAIAEFKVLRGLYSAEFGRSGAGQVNVITRSGTSNFHGTGYEFFRNDVLNANTYINNRNKTKRPALRYNNFGGTFGGPVYIPGLYEKKDKTFFFFSEEVRRVITYANYQATVPTANEKNGTFVVPTCLAGFSSATSTCGTILPANTSFSSMASINPVAAAYIKNIWNYVPAPDASSSYNAHTLNTTQRNVFNHRQELIKVDHVFSPKWQVNGRYLQDSIPTQEPGGLFGPNTQLPGVGTSATNSPGHSWVARATGNLTQNLLLETGYNYSYGAIVSSNLGRLSVKNSPDIANALNTANNGGAVRPFASTLDRLPTLSTNYSQVAGFGNYDDYNRDHSVFGNLSWVKGKHLFKWGGTYHRYQKTENAGGNNVGTFTFNSTGANAIYSYLAPRVTGISSGKTLANCSDAAITYDGQTMSCAALRSQITIAQGWTNFLAGNLASYTQDSMDITPDIRANQFEAFAQDEWRLHPRVTLTYGVRYSLFLQPTDSNAFLTTFDPRYYNASLAPTLDPKTGYVVLDSNKNWVSGYQLNGVIPTTGALKKCPQLLQQGLVSTCWSSGTVAPFGDSVTEQQKNNFAPRLGLAVDPFGDGKTSIRTGLGMFYDAVKFGMTEDNVFKMQPFVSSISLSGGTFSNPAGGTKSVSAVPKVLRASPQDFRTPYSIQWSFDVQHQFANDVLLDVGYYASQSHHLLGVVDLNSPMPGAYKNATYNGTAITWYPNGTSSAGITDCVVGGPSCITSTNIQQLNLVRPYKGFGAINSVESWFNANYHGLQVAFQKKFAGRGIFKANYTFAKALTDSQSDSTALQNTYDRRADYGYATLDRRHVFTANYVYDLPFFRQQHGFIGHVLGGWEASGIITVNSGLPLTITQSSSIYTYESAGLGCIGSSSCGYRPNVTGDPNKGPKTYNQWFDTSVFTPISTNSGVPGNAYRGIVRGPGLWRADLSMFKNVKMGERAETQIRLETFNVFNHTNFQTVSTALGSSTFGQITGTRDPRVVQVALKVNF